MAQAIAAVHAMKAVDARELSRVIVDSAVQEKVIARPADLNFRYFAHICFSATLHLSEYRVSAMPTTLYPLLTAAQLGEMLQAARKAQGLTQSALAARIGLSQSRISHLELHAHELSVEQLLAWCAALGLELAVWARDNAAVPTTTTDW